MDAIRGVRDVFVVASDARIWRLVRGRLLKSDPATTGIQFVPSVETPYAIDVPAEVLSVTLKRCHASRCSAGKNGRDCTHPAGENREKARLMSKSAGVRLLFNVWSRIRNCRYRSSGQPIGSGKLWGFPGLQ